MQYRFVAEGLAVGTWGAGRIEFAGDEVVDCRPSEVQSKARGWLKRGDWEGFKAARVTVQHPDDPYNMENGNGFMYTKVFRQ